MIHAHGLAAVIAKAVLPISVVAGFVMVLQPVKIEGVSPALVVEFGMFLAGIIGVAAVMRVDVGRLVKWQMRHTEVHEKLTELLVELKTGNEEFREETLRRLARIEVHEDQQR